MQVVPSVSSVCWPSQCHWVLVLSRSLVLVVSLDSMHHLLSSEVPVVLTRVIVVLVNVVIYIVYRPTNMF